MYTGPVYAMRLLHHEQGRTRMHRARFYASLFAQSASVGSVGNLASMVNAHQVSARRQAQLDAVSTLVDNFQPPLTPATVAREKAEAQAAADKKRRKDDERRRELDEVANLHDVLSARLPVNRDAPRRRAPGAPPVVQTTRFLGFAPAEEPPSLLPPPSLLAPKPSATYSCFPPPSPPMAARRAAAPAAAPKAVGVAASSAFAPRYVPTSSSTWKPAGLQPIPQAAEGSQAAYPGHLTGSWATRGPASGPRAAWASTHRARTRPSPGLPTPRW